MEVVAYHHLDNHKIEREHRQTKASLNPLTQRVAIYQYATYHPRHSKRYSAYCKHWEDQLPMTETDSTLGDVCGAYTKLTTHEK